MSLSATLFGEDSFIHKITNIMGLGIPGLLHKWATPDSETEPTRLGELSQQTAKEATPRPIVWGRVRPIGGNIIHCQTPKKRLVMSYQESGGKGGGKKKEKVYREHVYRSYAIGVCEGPITSYGRIWRNNKLVYDGRPDSAWGAKNNKVFLKKFRLYLGGWGQMPDSTLESIWGVGQVPAYRGTAYIVAVDEDLTEQAGMVPQWLFEVERAEGTYLTSRPYAIESVESLNITNPRAQRLRFRDGLIDRSAGAESINIGDPAVFSINFRVAEFEYYAEPQSIEMGSPEVSRLYFRSGVIPYTAEPQSVDMGDPEVSRLRLHQALLPYTAEEQSINMGNPTVSRLNFYVP